MDHFFIALGEWSRSPVMWMGYEQPIALAIWQGSAILGAVVGLIIGCKQALFKYSESRTDFFWRPFGGIVGGAFVLAIGIPLVIFVVVLLSPLLILAISLWAIKKYGLKIS